MRRVHRLHRRRQWNQPKPWQNRREGNSHRSSTTMTLYRCSRQQCRWIRLRLPSTRVRPACQRFSWMTCKIFLFFICTSKKMLKPGWPALGDAIVKCKLAGPIRQLVVKESSWRLQNGWLVIGRRFVCANVWREYEVKKRSSTDYSTSRGDGRVAHVQTQQWKSHVERQCTRSR